MFNGEKSAGETIAYFMFAYIVYFYVSLEFDLFKQYFYRNYVTHECFDCTRAHQDCRIR